MAWDDGLGIREVGEWGLGDGGDWDFGYDGMVFGEIFLPKFALARRGKCKAEWFRY